MPSPSSRRRCPATACRSRRGSRASASEAIADCFAELMTEVLGYERFAAQGGDWGAFIASRLGCGACRQADRHPRQPAGGAPRPDMVGDPTPEETPLPRRARAWLKEETGYQWIQGTRPQTLAFGLTDSPAGLAAWIVEKFRAWSDCGGDVESAFARDQLLANIASTGSPARSARRSGRTTRACTGPGRSRTARRRRADGLRRIPARDRAAAALRGRARSTPTSAAGP